MTITRHIRVPLYLLFTCTLNYEAPTRAMEVGRLLESLKRDPSLTELVYAAERGDMMYERVMNGNRAFDKYGDSRIAEKN